MDANLIIVDSDAELARALKFLDALMGAETPTDIARLQAQARLIEGYEQRRWPTKRPRTSGIIRYLMDQHGLSRIDMIPILGSASRVSEVLSGKKELSMTMVQRLRARFGVPADVLLPPVKAAKGKAKRKAA